MKRQYTGSDGDRKSKHRHKVGGDATPNNLRSTSNGTRATPDIQALNDVGVIELLSQDLRPTFIIDLTLDDSLSLQPVFCNPVLQASRCLKDIVLGKDIAKGRSVEEVCISYAAFKEWVMQPLGSQSRDVSLLSKTYKDILWRSSTLKGRWRMIRGAKDAAPSSIDSFALTPSFMGCRITELPEYFTSTGLDIDSLVNLRASLFGLGDDSRQTDRLAEKSPHLQLFYGLDWSSTSLGPLDKWPAQIQVLCDMVFADYNPAVLFFGPDSTMIYNEPYVSLLGSKHPKAMGSRPAESLSEVWDQVACLLDQGRKTSRPIHIEDTLFSLNRHGFTEETYFSSTFFPLLDGSGVVVGFYESVFEVTQNVLAERRMTLLNLAQAQASTMQSPKDFWIGVARLLEVNNLDIISASIVSVPQDTAQDPISPISSTPLQDGNLPANNLNLLQGFVTDPLESSLVTKHEELLTVISKGAKLKSSQIFQSCSQNSPDCEDCVQHPKIGSSNRATAIVCPILFANTEHCTHVLLFGISQELPFNDDYENFVGDFAQLMITSIQNIAINQMEREREAQQAREHEIEQARLAEELRLRTLDVRMEETKFTRLAESAPIGIFILGQDGFKYRNRKLFEITGAANVYNPTPFLWNAGAVHESEYTRLDSLRKEVFAMKTGLSFELKLKKLWDPPDADAAKTREPVHAWILCSVQPNEFRDDGTTASIVGVITDISHQKWAEGDQARRKEDALESKQQQEAFVDMVSHEIRNPLSAILTSAEGIEESLLLSADTAGSEEEVRRSNLDAAQIIIHCVQHQKRIIDDILSLSKLDSDLLLITPVDAQPVEIVRETLNMLSSAARSADVVMDMDVSPSYGLLNVESVLLDPSRLTQVLINLLTNAIKFTQDRPIRKVRVSIGASLTRPTNESSEIRYLPAKANQEDPTLGADWGSGEKLCILFAVKDTGRGLSEEEKKVLFQRFSQASARTHVNYGGSGLGLYISRSLVEKQGGEIGVAGDSGKGSTFAFFIKSRRSTATPRGGTPLAVPTPQINHGSPTYTLRMSHAPPLTMSTGMSSSKIRVINVLVVEDNLVNQRVTSKQLRQKGCVVYVANHGVEALDMLKASNLWKGNEAKGKQLSMVLMDQEMPVMDGITCIRKIRELESDGSLISHVPVIAVTANARTQQIDVLKAAGMDDVLLKPFRIADLMSQMDRLLDRLDQ